MIAATIGGIQLKTIIYEDTNQIFFEVINPVPANPGGASLKINQLRNMAFDLST
jgi:hypothetical protein